MKFTQPKKPSTWTYFVLMGIQTVGAAIILGSAFPAYRQILLEPGQELNLSWATHLWATVGGSHDPVRLLVSSDACAPRGPEAQHCGQPSGAFPGSVELHLRFCAFRVGVFPA